MRTISTRLSILAVATLSTMLLSCHDDDPVDPQLVTDIDGNTYHTVSIGNQVWLKENLRVTRYNNGDVIPNVTEDLQWSSLTTGAWCYYDNDDQNNAVYGKLYNGFTVMDKRNICPKGWHIPSDDEWTELETATGSPAPGGALKEGGMTHWNSPNTGATNTTGFTALPGGFRGAYGGFLSGGVSSVGINGLWWSDSVYDDMSLWIRVLDYLFDGFTRQDGHKGAALSCRCLKD